MGVARKLGTLEAVIYFRNYADRNRPTGWLVLAPYSDCPTPPGYEREAADSLPEIDRLQTRLYEQELGERSADLLHDERVFGPMRDAIRDRLMAKLISSATSDYEKDFIRVYLDAREERRKKWHARYLEFVTYLTAREFDTPRDRPVDSERVNLDRVNF